MPRTPFNRKPCVTCKSRKVKCDGQRPTCRRCQSSLLVCKGYDDFPKFVNHTTNSNRTTTTRISRPDSPQWQNLSISMLACPSSNRQRESTLHLRAFSQDICLAYLGRNLFVGGPPGQTLEANSWVLTALVRDTTTTIFPAAKCVASAYFAGLHGQDFLIRDGALAYVEGLRRLNTSLCTPTEESFSSHLIAMILFSFYEFLCPTARAGLHQHTSGIESLLRSVKPKFFETSYNLSYYLQSRPFVIGGSLLFSRRTILSDDDWKRIPWARTRKSLYHRIWDILSDVSGLLEAEQQRRPETYNVQLNDQDARLSTQVFELLRQLKYWRWQWESRHGGCAFSTVIDLIQTFVPQQDPAYARVNQNVAFRDHFRAREIMLYNTAMLHLLRLAKVWRSNSSAALENPSSNLEALRGTVLTMPHPDLSINEVITDILRSVDFHILQSRVKAGLSLLVLALHAMLKCRTREEPMDWLDEMLQRIADVSGIKLFGILTII